MIGTILFFLLFGGSYLVAKSRINDKMSLYFVAMYLFYWGASLSISCLNPYDLYNVSFETYFTMSLNVVFFLCGFLSVRIRANDGARYDLPIESLLASKTFNFLLYIGIAFSWSLFFTKKSIVGVNDYDESLFRADFFELMFENNAGMLYAYYLFLHPLFFFLMSLVSYMLFFQRKWSTIILSLLFIVPFISLSSGRQHYVTFALMLFLTFVLYKISLANYRISKKIYAFGTVTVLGLYMIMASLTSNRAGTSLREGADELNYSFVTYSINPFRTYDYAISHDYVKTAGGYKYGRASFCGADHLVSSLLKRVGINYKSVRSDTNDYLQNNPVQTGVNSRANYCYTAVMYYFYDFGYIGVVLFPLLFGFFCRKVISWFSRYKTFYSYALLLFVFYIAIHSVFSWYFNKLYTLPYIIILYCLRKKTNRYVK